MTSRFYPQFIASLPAALMVGGALLLATSGCDTTSFDPYAEPDQVFSVFGFLDATQGTHRLRVEPLKDEKPYGTDSTLKATATLRNMESGQEVSLRNNRIIRNGEVRHNLVLEASLKRDTRYRLTVARTTGNERSSTATVTLPHAVPEISLPNSAKRVRVRGGTEDRLLFLNVTYRVEITEAVRGPAPTITYEDAFQFMYARRVTRTETGYTDWLTREEDIRSMYQANSSVTSATIKLLGVDVKGALVHPSAPDYEALSYKELFSPGVAPSNVEGGIGFVAGVARDGASVTLPPDEQIQIDIDP